jgi:hypothetical protein
MMSITRGNKKNKKMKAQRCFTHKHILEQKVVILSATNLSKKNRKHIFSFKTVLKRRKNGGAIVLSPISVLLPLDIFLSFFFAGKCCLLSQIFF